MAGELWLGMNIDMTVYSHAHTSYCTQMLRTDVLKGIVFPDVMIDWLQIFMDEFSSLLIKAKGAFSSGKAYAIKYQRIGS